MHTHLWADDVHTHISMHTHLWADDTHTYTHTHISMHTHLRADDTHALHLMEYRIVGGIYGVSPVNVACHEKRALAQPQHLRLFA
jgi:L-serine deaminase